MSVDGAKGFGSAMSGVTSQGDKSMDAAQQTTQGEMEAVRDSNAAGQKQSQAVNPANRSDQSQDSNTPRDATSRAHQESSV